MGGYSLGPYPFQTRVLHFNRGVQRKMPPFKAVTLILGIFDAVADPWKRGLGMEGFYDIPVFVTPEHSLSG